MPSIDEMTGGQALEHRFPDYWAGRRESAPFTGTLAQFADVLVDEFRADLASYDF